MPSRAKKVVPVTSRKDLESYVENFFKAGGKVKRIERGVSGQTTTKGPRQIVLNHRSIN